VPDTHTYDYAVIRVVPDVQRGEFINCGVILFCRTRRFLAAEVALDESRLQAINADADVVEIRRHLALIPRLCAGDQSAGPIAMLSQSERFNWLVAPRSAVIQMSPVHSGITDTPDQALQRLMASMVLKQP
jgi:hypothetical protein